MAVLILLVTIATYAFGEENILYSFCALPGCSDGSYPEAGVILDKAGNLYGTTNAGGSGAGTVFMLTASSGKLSSIYTFMGGDDGLGPNSLAFDNKGNLYGTTEYGGGAGDCSNGGCGTIFELILVNGSWTKNVLYRFAGGTDGSIPQAGVILDPHGNLYGTTWKGGTGGYGTVFELQHSESGWTEILLHTFGGNDGSAPISGLIRDRSGNLYGTTSQGGVANVGTVFRLSHNKEGWKETVLHSFTGSSGDGAVPYAGSLAFDTAGNLYGTTSAGGSVNSGTVFELMRPKSRVATESILYSFLGGSSGSAPYTGVIIDSAGTLYGTTSIGGKGGDGTVFSLKNVSGQWTESVLYSFDGPDGSEPIGNLIFGIAGELYGTAGEYGAHGAGELYEITLSLDRD
jgi:uncharacterized repeat protein (TIGR03803 family)